MKTKTQPHVETLLATVLALRDHVKDLEAYIEKLELWHLMDKNGQLDIDMHKPAKPTYGIPF